MMALFSAINHGNLEIFECHIKARASVTSTLGSHGVVPLNSAARAGQVKLVKYLLDQKVQVDSKTDSGETFLLCALKAWKILPFPGPPTRESEPHGETSQSPYIKIIHFPETRQRIGGF